MQPKTLLLLLTAVAGASAVAVTDVLNDPKLTTLKSLVGKYPKLGEALLGAEELTVFAPTDEAFTKAAALPGWAAIAADEAKVEQILKYHVVGKKINARDIEADNVYYLETLVDSTYNDFRNLTKAQVIKAYVNGTQVDLVSGKQALSKVVNADIAFDNGVAHTIDSVLMPPVSVSETATELKFSKLVDALKKAGLVETVDTLKDVTIFAPVDAAFDKVTGNPSVDDLKKILTFHVVAGTVAYSENIKDGDELTTVQGGKLKVTIKDGSVFVNNVKVVATDVLTNNGVIHAVEGVLDYTKAEPASPTTSGAANPATSIPAAGSGASSIFSVSSIAAFGGLIAAAWGMI